MKVGLNENKIIHRMVDGWRGTRPNCGGYYSGHKYSKKNLFSMKGDFDLEWRLSEEEEALRILTGQKMPPEWLYTAMVCTKCFPPTDKKVTVKGNVTTTVVTDKYHDRRWKNREDKPKKKKVVKRGPTREATVATYIDCPACGTEKQIVAGPANTAIEYEMEVLKEELQDA